MTEEDRLLLIELKENTQQLFKEYNYLKTEKNLLEERVLELKNDVGLLEREKSELGQKNEQLKIAAHILSGIDENRVAKLKINKLIREIDKCIALLNK
ncbi:MAG: hypothetical protein HN778_07775 [Prolixibacteraceae bacterium]|jgi:hypothetical protein|nr:hypothetical protein [Prolixibacteraceae bacterium]MBT6005203.1 hypothetical protein [Prolixibacteraceae bacterium]MBT6766350.1 hypothetical protein [Prolixibacteraceae bacterium]MBT6999819.1 hypothetical protein [Prolixibacteraceae bacterium]MBT7394716.1 hypothetical protein [Prolixibacteraceae bacterium]